MEPKRLDPLTQMYLDLRKEFGPIIAKMRMEIEIQEARLRAVEDWQRTEEAAAEDYWEAQHKTWEDEEV